MSSCKLKHIDYFFHLFFEDTCPSELIKDLVIQSNILSNYCEWEVYRLNSSKNHPFMARRSVAMKWQLDQFNQHSIIVYIQRTFDKTYTWNELVEYDSFHTSMIIEQVFDEYRNRSIATYLKIAFMEGCYYSMEKAVKIIESSNLSEDKRDDLISALELVRKHGGILNAKIVHEDKREKLYEFVNILHELVDLGINHVTIPEKYNIEKLPNPIQRYFKQPNNLISDEKKASSRLEIEEEIGHIDMPCRTS